MPMKRSGRSVDDANRVIEIDEVFVARMASDLSDVTYIGKDLALDLFFFGCGFDHQIAIRKRVVIFRRLDARQRALAIFFADRLLADLARPYCR